MSEHTLDDHKLDELIEFAVDALQAAGRIAWVIEHFASGDDKLVNPDEHDGDVVLAAYKAHQEAATQAQTLTDLTDASYKLLLDVRRSNANGGGERA